LSWDLNHNEDPGIQRAAWSLAKKVKMVFAVAYFSVVQDICVNPVIAKIDPSVLKTLLKWIAFFLLHSHQMQH
jgi:hypothetical protein